MSAAEFLEALFGALPALFKSEDELRGLWSLPETRKALLEQLSERGFSRDNLAEMQKIVSAEKR
jgi:type I restriction enzyme R subunit